MPRRWIIEDLPDLTDRKVVVTGASSGLGLITARELAAAGASVTLAVRDTEKGERVARTMTGDVSVAELDVSSLPSVRDFAAAQTSPIDVLVNNAGIMQVPFARTADGFEIQIATNYLGPFALTQLLLPQITDRVVTLSSQLHRVGRVSLTDLNWRDRPYNELQAYTDSKLADIQFALELSRRLAKMGSSVRSIIAHPGIATTSLASHASGFSGWVNNLGPLLNTPARGALSVLFAATQDVPSGTYVGPRGPGGISGHSTTTGRPSRRARNELSARDLWDLSARLTDTVPTPTTSISPSPSDLR